MRLRVSVKRHALPTTNIIFTTRALGPSPATSSTDATIAQLLEDVNDIIPLESPDWGLEDYAVEVDGYECLHFAPINVVLRDDDQVVIRALKTQDLRSRRLGGRHQISSDGRHLIDGVAFGRQWLKKGGRPSVSIPPRRRRRRFKIGGTEQEKGPEAESLALTVISDANDLDDEDSNGEDSDFVDEDGDEPSDDGSHGETGPDVVIDTQAGLQIVARQDFEDADDESPESDEERTSDEDLEENESLEQDGELSAELQALRDEEQSQNANVKGRRQEIPQQSSLSNGSAIRSSGRKRKRTLDHDSKDSDGSDFNGFSSPLAKRVKATKVPPQSDPDSDSNSSSGSDSDEDSELEASLPSSQKRQSLDGSSDSDSSSDSSEETSNSASSSDDDSVSEDESSGSGSSSSKTSDAVDSNEESTHKAPPKSKPITLVQESITPSVMTSSADIRPPVPPGQGLRRTRYGNLRQKKRYRLRKLKELGVLSENATFIDMAAYDEAQQTAPLGPVAAAAKVVEAKKQQLLGQVEEQLHGLEDELAPVQTQAQEHTSEQGSDMAWEASEKPLRGRQSTTQRSEAPFTGASSEQSGAEHTPLHKRGATDPIGPLLAPVLETRSAPSKQRSRLDLDSTRNMIFNGLGVRKPKTAAAEQVLREKLAKPIKGALPRQLFKDAEMKQDGGSVGSNNPRVRWEHKLVVSAVECEVNGLTLSEPPFPFVQRWDEDASRRLRSVKKKGRNQMQYYACDDNRGSNWYGEEPEDAQDQDESMLYDDADEEDTLDQLTTRATNMIDEVRDQLNAKVGDGLAEDAEDLPRPHNIDSLDALQQSDALPLAVIAYKEIHLNTVTFQPEISDYRVARVEAVREDGTLDLTVSKRDRKPPTMAKYNEVTGKRILSRSEMFEGGEDGGEDDGRRLMAFAELREPKLVELSKASKPMASRSQGTESQMPDGSLLSVSGSAVVAESTVSDHPSFPSAQPLTFQPVTVAEPENAVHFDLTTPRRMEISLMMKEAGFDSNLDSEFLRPINGTADSAQNSSPRLDVTREAMNQTRKRSAEPASEIQDTPLDTSGFDSPRFNRWSSSPPIEPEPDEVIEETNLDQRPISSQTGEAQPEEEEANNDSLTPRHQVTYPHISQLELDTSTQESPAAQLRGGGGLSSPGDVDEEANVVYREHSADEVVGTRYSDSLKSVVSPSVKESSGAEELVTKNGHATATFLGGSDGQMSSDDDDMPSLARITSMARAQSSRVSPPPVTRRGMGKATRRRQSTSPAYMESSASASQPLMKPSQSQVRLSQIPPGSQVVDLTFSSDPVSPGNSDGEYGKTRLLARSSNRAKTGTKEGGVEKCEALVASVGLGNRRLLKSKKAKP